MVLLLLIPLLLLLLLFGGAAAVFAFATADTASHAAASVPVVAAGRAAQLRNDGESGRAKFEYTPGRLPLHRLAVRPGGYRCTVTR